MGIEPGFEVSLRPEERPAKQQRNRMFPAARSVHRFLLSTFCLLLLASPAMAQEAKSIIALREGKGGDAPRVKRVLILHALGRDFAPFNALSSSFRTALAEQSATPIEFFEASLESTLFAEDGSEAFLVDYLRARFANRPADLVVPIGAPGLMFLQRHRDKLFPGVPILVVGPDERRMSNLRSDANATAIGINFDFPGIIQNILQTFPSTTRIEVVTGNSPFEKFWMTELRRDVQPFTDRVRFEWLNELSLRQYAAAWLRSRATQLSYISYWWWMRRPCRMNRTRPLISFDATAMPPSLASLIINSAEASLAAPCIRTRRRARWQPE